MLTPKKGRKVESKKAKTFTSEQYARYLTKGNDLAKALVDVTLQARDELVECGKLSCATKGSLSAFWREFESASPEVRKAMEEQIVVLKKIIASSKVKKGNK